MPMTHSAGEQREQLNSEKLVNSACFVLVKVCATGFHLQLNASLIMQIFVVYAYANTITHTLWPKLEDGQSQSVGTQFHSARDHPQNFASSGQGLNPIAWLL